MNTRCLPCQRVAAGSLSGVTRTGSSARGTLVGRKVLRPLPWKRAVDCFSGNLDEIVCCHPDAIRRRNEAEARKRQLEQEQNQQQTSHWWDVRGTANLVLAKSPMELMDLVGAAQARANLVVVKYFAPHCVACRTMFPKIKQIAETNPEVLFVKVNAGEDEMRAFCEDLGINKVPFFHFYEEGNLTGEFTANLQSISRLRAELAARRKLIEEVAASKRQLST